MKNLNLAVQVSPLKKLVKDFNGAETKTASALKIVLRGIYPLVYQFGALDIEEQDDYRSSLIEFAGKEGATIKLNDCPARILIKALFKEQNDNRKACYSNIILRGIYIGKTPEQFGKWLDQEGIEKAGKSLVSVKKVPIDNIKEGKKKLANAEPFVVIDRTKEMPQVHGRVVALCNNRRDGTTEVIGVCSDEKLIDSLISKVGTGQVDILERLDGKKKESAIEALKLKALESFKATSDYSGEISDCLASLYKPRAESDFVYPSDRAKMLFDMWCEKSSSQLLFLEGPHGTGKTTLTQLAPKVMYPKTKCVIKEISLNKPLKNVTQELEKLVVDIPAINSTQPLFIVINEAQALIEKNKDLSILRPLLETQANNVHIIMTSNKPVIDVGVSSRAVNIHLGKYQAERWQPRLAELLRLEGILCSDKECMLDLSRLIGGDVRELLGVFDELIFRFNKLTHTNNAAQVTSA